MSAAEGIQKRRAQLAKRASRKSSSGQPKKLTKKQKRIRWASYAGGAILLLLIIIAGCTPRKGTMLYGVCLVFTERLVDYPSTLKVNYVEQYQMATRIGFSHIDPFGQFSTEMIECAYRTDPKMGLALDSILLNREEIDNEIVEEFNQGIPAIVKNSPDLTLPPPMPKELIDLKR